MAIQLPSPRSQAGGTPNVVRRDTSGPSTGELLVGLAGALAPTLQRAGVQAAKQAAAQQDAADDVTIGNLIADQNQTSIDQSIATQLTGELQQSELEVARAYEDNKISETESKIINDYMRKQKSLETLRTQNPAAFSQQKSIIKQKLQFQEALKNNPRLGAKLLAANNSLMAGPGKIAGPQAQQVLKVEQEITSIYGVNATTDQRLEFADFKVLEKNNAELTRRNDIRAKAGTLTLDAIVHSTTQNLDLTLAMIDTKYVEDKALGHGFAKDSRIEDYVKQLEFMKVTNRQQVWSQVSEHNKRGGSLISRDAANASIDNFSKEIDAKIELYKSGGSQALIKQLSTYQKEWMAINGGNAAALTRSVSGNNGDNLGAILALTNQLKGGESAGKNAWNQIAKDSGADRLTESNDILAGKIASWMSDGVPLPANLQRAAVYHGVLAAREGPINENTQTALLEGISTLAVEDGVSAAAKLLQEDSTARQLSGPKLKQTVRSMDGITAADIAASGRSVTFDKDTNTFAVFSLRNRTQVTGDEFIPETRQLTDEERVVTDAELTKDLNNLYGIRTGGKYTKDLENPAEFVKQWTTEFPLVDVEGEQPKTIKELTATQIQSNPILKQSGTIDPEALMKQLGVKDFTDITPDQLVDQINKNIKGLLNDGSKDFPE